MMIKGHWRKILVAFCLILVVGLYAIIVSNVVTPTKTGIYTLPTDAYNVANYIEVNGEVVRTVITHDAIILVNPVVEGNRVYTSRNNFDRNQNSREFFLIDQLEKVEGIVYQLKPGTKSYITLKKEALIPKEDGIGWDYNEPYETILINPEIKLSGMYRIFVSEWKLILKGKGLKEGEERDPEERHLFYRSDLVLLQH